MPNIYAMRLSGDKSQICGTTQADREAIHAMLHAANGKAQAHTINYSSIVSALARRAENMLDAAGLRQRDRIGARLAYRPSGPSASAYKYRAATTAITLVRNSVGWRVLGIGRTDIWPRAPELFDLHISQGQAVAVQANALRPFSVETGVTGQC
tara:strand:+ start:1642 stop:2103 length:462 start_codon:yes stop_codon:yes gene_type:complete